MSFIHLHPKKFAVRTLALLLAFCMLDAQTTLQTNHSDPTLYSFTQEALSPQGLLVGQNVISNLTPAVPKKSRRAFLLFSAAAAATGASTATQLWGQPPTLAENPTIDYPPARKSIAAFMASKKKKVQFRKTNSFREKEISDIIRILIAYRTSIRNKFGITHQMGFAAMLVAQDQDLRWIYDLQKEAWEKMAASKSSDAKELFGSTPFSMAAFENFLFYQLPVLAGNHGLFPEFDERFVLNSRGPYFLTLPNFYEIIAEEKSDLGPSLKAALARENVFVDKRWILGGALDENFNEIPGDPTKTGITYYQSIGQFKAAQSTFARKLTGLVADVIEAYRSAERQPGPVGEINFPAILERLQKGDNPFNLALDAVLLFFAIEVTGDFSQGKTLSELSSAIEERVKSEVDQHEGIHILNLMDPNHEFEQATSIDHYDNSAEGFLSAEEYLNWRNSATIHEENGALAAALVYEKPTDALLMLLMQPGAPLPVAYDSYLTSDQHRASADWDLSETLNLLSKDFGNRKGYGAKLGMHFKKVPGVSFSDEIIAQLPLFLKPNNAKTVAAFGQELVNAYRVNLIKRRYTMPVTRAKSKPVSPRIERAA